VRLAAGRLDVETSPKEIRVLCQSCAENIFANLGPSEQYALAVARLLFMVAAHESGGFQYRRQLGFAWSNGFGAHGLWQIEWASVSDSIGMLRRKSALAQRSARWLFRDSHAPSWWFDASINLPSENVLRTVYGYIVTDGYLVPRFCAPDQKETLGAHVSGHLECQLRFEILEGKACILVDLAH